MVSSKEEDGLQRNAVFLRPKHCTDSIAGAAMFALSLH
uniref:Uncharacterized protein n=1 Tax=Fagus sylvatica TaxID=28930 RepID=A0A2N9GXA9_FAGSY